jgi:hypothetical protein
MIKDKRAITKDGTEVVGESTTPDALIDEPSTAVEVQDSKGQTMQQTRMTKKMPAFDGDTPSQGEKKEDIDRKDDDAIQGTTTPVTNLPLDLT